MAGNSKSDNPQDPDRGKSETEVLDIRVKFLGEIKKIIEKEGWSLSDAAYITGIDEEEMQELLQGGVPNYPFSKVVLMFNSVCQCAQRE